MRSNFVFFVGAGGRVRFWEDKWYGDDTLSHSFPSLFELAASKDEWVVEVWVALGKEWTRTLIFLGHLMIGRWKQ